MNINCFRRKTNVEIKTGHGEKQHYYYSMAQALKMFP